MSEPNPVTFLSDPLSDVSRKERRNLLIASTVGALMAHAGLVPTQVSALGIEFPVPAQSSFLVVMAAIVAYFVLAFFIYALADFVIWRKRRHEYIVSLKIAEDNISYDEEMELHRLNVPSIAWYFEWSPRVAYVRVFFEFVLPQLVGLYSLGALLFTVWRP